MYTTRIVLLLASTFLAACASSAATPTDTDIDCRQGHEGMVVPQFMPRALRAQARVIDARAERLADTYRTVEAMLREAGYEPQAFAEADRSWAAISRDGEYLIAVYERTDDELIKLDAFGTESHGVLLPLLDDVDMALLHTPTDCSLSFGVLDAGITDDNGDELLYSLRLPASPTEIVWGMHYRFHRRDGALRQAQRLHHACEVRSVVVTDEMLAAAPPRILRMIQQAEERGRRVMGMSVLVPEHELPTEAHMMQLRLYPDAYWRLVRIWGRDGFVDVKHDSPTIPDKYGRRPNPCIISESSDG